MDVHDDEEGAAKPVELLDDDRGKGPLGGVAQEPRALRPLVERHRAGDPVVLVRASKTSSL